MKMPLFLTAIILSLISVSCSEENQLTEPLREQSSISLSQIKGISYDSNIITKDDAIFVATKFLNRKRTRSEIYDAIPLYDSTGKQIGHVVNFSDSGFCIVSSTKDLPPILAYSSKGNFNINNINKTGISIWRDNLSYSQEELTKEEKDSNRRLWNIYESSSLKSRAMDDTEKTAALNKRMAEIHEEFGMSIDVRPLIVFKGSDFINNSYYEMFKNKGGSEFYTIVGVYKKNLGPQIDPYITTQWGQQGVFGKYAVNKFAGCTVIAAGQLMNYFQYPKTYDWNAIASNCYINESVAVLSKDIQDRFKVKYEENKTSSTISNVKEGLKSFGYSVSETDEIFAYRLIEKYHKPLYEQGVDDDGDGHAWVIDGYITFDYQYYYIVEYLRGNSGSYRYERDNTIYSAGDDNMVVSVLTHYNWGWDGREDGYYVTPPKYKNKLKQLNLSIPQ